jgi:transporter family protein
MSFTLSSWQFWAVLSAVFAALTAIFAKIGVESVNADFATLVRTIIILLVLAAILSATGEWQNPATISGRTYLFLALSGLATGASWICYFRALQLGDAARVAPIDKLSVVLVAIFGTVLSARGCRSPTGWASPSSPAARCWWLRGRSALFSACQRRASPIEQDRPNLVDRGRIGAAQVARRRNGRVEGRAVHDIEAEQLFLGLGKGSVDDHAVALAAQGHRTLCRAKPGGRA